MNANCSSLVKGLEYEEIFKRLLNKRRSLAFTLYKNNGLEKDHTYFDFILKSPIFDFSIPLELKTQTETLEKINFISKGQITDHNKVVTFSWDDYDHYKNKYPQNLLVCFWILREGKKSRYDDNVEIAPLDAWVCIKISDLILLCDRAMNNKLKDKEKDPNVMYTQHCYFFNHNSPSMKKQQKFYLNIDHPSFYIIDILSDPCKILHRKSQMQKNNELMAIGENMAIESHGDFDTTDKYWDCECEKNYIHAAFENRCDICGESKEEAPDSRVFEVLYFYPNLSRKDL